MSTLVVTDLDVSFGPHRVLRSLNLTVPDGSLAAVVGPSGCGKTTLLRAIAGFVRPSGGNIALDEVVVAGPSRLVPPEKRGIGLVPQEGALFPHLDVAGNVGFGLKRGERSRARVAELLELVGLADAANQQPHELSGGMQQRVALARALAPRPSVVLLDEPFSALDAGLRASVREDVAAVLRADGATAVLVTHDQGEALAWADVVAVMESGRVLQTGSPGAVYARPADLTVARFVGECVELAGCVRRTADGFVADTPIGTVALAAGERDIELGEATIVVRPEQVVVDREVTSSGGASAVVVSTAYHGHDALLSLALEDGMHVLARVAGNDLVPVGTGVRVDVRGEALHYPAADTGPTPG